VSPLDNIKYLKNAKLFIAHGKKDKCIHYSKSISYYKKILKNFPRSGGRFKLNLYPKGGHDYTTTQLAVSDFLKWIL
jgi:predicted esterase